MSIHAPEAGWLRAPGGGERLWIGLALAWCVILSLAMPYWHFKGKQNSTGEAYRVTREPPTPLSAAGAGDDVVGGLRR